jgi:hypothetical protein
MNIINEALTIIRSDLDMYHSRAVHYRMKAAEFSVMAAKSAVDEAETAASAANVTVQGWQAAEQHLHLEMRRAELTSTQAALEEKTQAARPLQDQLEKTRAHLAGALHRALDRAEAESPTSLLKSKPTTRHWKPPTHKSEPPNNAGASSTPNSRPSIRPSPNSISRNNV